MKSHRSSTTTLEVTAIVTAMTDGEQSFVKDTIVSVLADEGIGQLVLMVDEKNAWIDAILLPFISDSRLEVVRIPLMPLGAVRNKALESVRMPWVAYCDGDDVWYKGKTLTQLNFAKETGSDFVGVDYYLTNEKGEIRAFEIARYIPMPSSWMIKTEVMKQHLFTNIH